MQFRNQQFLKPCISSPKSATLLENLHVLYRNDETVMHHIFEFFIGLAITIWLGQEDKLATGLVYVMILFHKAELAIQLGGMVTGVFLLCLATGRLKRFDDAIGDIFTEPTSHFYSTSFYSFDYCIFYSLYYCTFYSTSFYSTSYASSSFYSTSYASLSFYSTSYASSSTSFYSTSCVCSSTSYYSTSCYSAASSFSVVSPHPPRSTPPLESPHPPRTTPPRDTPITRSFLFVANIEF
ncbi:hypothetical protein OROMI_012512 [Orobanche minor]